ncbi:MAG: N-acetylneuraminate synthase [Alphaproteobacteria bacterium]|nr:N-acetylneuraminate synthase [Alphaproteobacteria bacterium]
MSRRVVIIAEAGVNHNGSINLAFQMVDKAAEAGANVVKFQTFRAAGLVTRTAAKARYQRQLTSKAESQFEMLKRLELSPQQHRSLQMRCGERGIEFLSTPFDVRSLELLLSLGLNRIKIPSGEITNTPLLVAVGYARRLVMLSTGMASIGEIEGALAGLAFGFLRWKNPSERKIREAYLSTDGRKWLRKMVTLLHCTSEYPAPIAEVNLRVIDTLRRAFGLPVGYSDHTVGTAIPIAAAALGACVIEKHFTLDRTLPGPDHKASLEPHELALMVEGIRAVERALGTAVKAPTPSELGNLDIVRKSLVAARPIRRGERFSAANLTVKRPAGGLAPALYWEIIGRQADRNYPADALIQW